MIVTKEHIELYAKITGDYNPLHFDEDFASKTKFRRLVSQGGITTGILHSIVAMKLPGPGTVFLNQNFQFMAPVYIGETITGEVEISEIHETKPVTKLKVKVWNQDEKTVLEGTAVCYTMKSN
jgi:acyl dehydratase